MKKTATVLIALLVCAFSKHAYSQLSENIDENIKLLISMDTNSLSVGSKATVFIQITNCSTNASCSVGDYPIQDSSLFLTNSGGSFYKLSHLRSPSWDKNFYHPQSYVIAPNQTYGWSLNFKVDKDIHAGNYLLEATRLVNVTTLNLTNRIKFKLKSNLLEVKIKQL